MLHLRTHTCLDMFPTFFPTTLALVADGLNRTVAIVDLGYRGREVDGVQVLHCGKAKTLTRRQWRWIKRRQAVEPVIGHLKDDCRLRRCRLKGAQGDALHVLGCAAGYNLRWLLRWIAFLRAWMRAMGWSSLSAVPLSPTALCA